MGNIESRGVVNDSFDMFSSNLSRRQQNLMDYFNSNGTPVSTQPQASTFHYPTNQVCFLPDRSRLIRDLSRDSSNTLSDVCEYIAFRCSKNLDFRIMTKNNLTNKLNNLIIKSYEKKLLDIFKCKQNSNETIFSKIMLKFNQFEVNSQEFIRALVIAFCMSCFDSSHRFDINLAQRRIKILSLFIYQNEDLELQALYAIQDFSGEVVPQQPDFLFVLYDMFYENDIISERVFMSALDSNELNYMLRHSRKHSEKITKLINESMANNLIQFQNSFSTTPINYNYTHSIEPINNTYASKSTHSDFIYDENSPIANWMQNEMNFFTNSNSKETTPIETNKTSISSKSSTLNKNQNREKEPECPVCMETYSDLKREKKSLMSTICGHIMCKGCSDHLFKISSKRITKKKVIDCPVCRRTVDTSGVHEIYI